MSCLLYLKEEPFIKNDQVMLTWTLENKSHLYQFVTPLYPFYLIVTH